MPGTDAHVNDPGPELWFNPAAFVNPGDFSIGNVPRAHPSLRNPGFHNHDLSVSKRLPLPSERSLDILFEGFNFLNHANWNDPDAYIGPNANAGKIIGSWGGRVVQLGLRFNFLSPIAVRRHGSRHSSTFFGGMRKSNCVGAGSPASTLSLQQAALALCLKKERAPRSAVTIR